MKDKPYFLTLLVFLFILPLVVGCTLLGQSSTTRGTAIAASAALDLHHANSQSHEKSILSPKRNERELPKNHRKQLKYSSVTPKKVSPFHSIAEKSKKIDTA